MKYEYRVLPPNATERELNELGNVGFRLVHTPRYSKAGFVDTQSFHYVFERES
jgi:hypothetical protein